MSAKIEIRTGPDAGRVFCIEEDLCRIGSGPASNFCVEGLDEHALTVHCRDGQYFVINRSRQPVRLNGRKLQPNESATWEHEQVLQVNGQHAFVLKLDGDPAAAPSMPRAVPSVLSPEAYPEAEEAVPAKPSRARRLVLIGVAVLVVFWLTAGPRTRGTPAIHAEFDRIVSGLAAQTSADDVRLCFVRENLQAARALELQGNYPAAAGKYAGILGKCLKRYGRDAKDSIREPWTGDARQELENRAREFIASRLEVLRGT